MNPKNHKEYLELLSDDINIIFKTDDSSLSDREKAHSLRVKVLIFHLHADYLLSEIITRKFQDKMTLSENKEKYDTKDMGFIEKLRLVYSIGAFDEGFFNALRILNKVRNNLSHNLLPSINDEEQRIRSLKIEPILFGEEYLRSLTPMEHLLYGSLTYINVLAEYLYKDILGEKLNWILSVNIPTRGKQCSTTYQYPKLSVVPRAEPPASLI